MENENIPVFYVIVYRQSNTARTNVKIISKITWKQRDKIYFHMCLK